MSVKDGIRDGAIVGVALIIYFAIKNFDRLTLFGGKDFNLYPKLDGKQTNDKITDPNYFNPDAIPLQNQFSLEMLAIQKLANKYNRRADGSCVTLPNVTGIYSYIPETGFYNNETDLVLFNSYGITGIPSYKEFRNHIINNIGLDAFNSINCLPEQKRAT
jgi:hypothetical protein